MKDGGGAPVSLYDFYLVKSVPTVTESDSINVQYLRPTNIVRVVNILRLEPQTFSFYSLVAALGGRRGA